MEYIKIKKEVREEDTK